MIHFHLSHRQRLLLLFTFLFGMSACDIGTLPPGVALGDAMKFSHLCADSFRIINRFMRDDGPGMAVRVVASWPRPGGGFPIGSTLQVKVPWAPNASQNGALTFRIPIPPGIHATIIATPLVGSSAPSITITNDGPGSCHSQPLVRLRQGIGLGLTGSITPAIDSVPVGSRVDWNFAPTSGYQGVDVRINGARVAAIGSMQIDSETTITAVGTLQPVTSPLLDPLIASARALLTSTTPHASAQRLLDDLLTTLATVDEATGDRLLEDFQSQAIPGDISIDAVLRLDSLLSGAVFKASIPAAPALRDGPVPFPAEPTTWFVAAGILTTQEKLAATAKVVRALVHEHALLGANDLVRAFVSPTMTNVGPDVKQCILRTLSPRDVREKANAFLTHCLIIYGRLLDGIDFVEATSQIFRQWFGGVPPRETSMNFMDSLENYRSQGYHLIIDSHSQGTLIAREATAEMNSRRSYQYSRDSLCIAVVSMAGPTSGNWIMPAPYVKEFATDGDLVAAMGGSTALRIPTDLSRQRDSALATLPASQIGLRVGMSLGYAFMLHDLQGVYLGESPPRNHLIASNFELRRECEAERLSFAIPVAPYPIYKGEEFPLGLYYQLYNYNGRALRGRPIKVAAPSQAFVDVINDFSIFGHNFGTATVTASSGGRSSPTPIEVIPPPILGVGGSYSGTWKILFSDAGGTVSLQLAEAGSVTRDGVPQVTGSVTYTHPGGTYTVPMIDGQVTLGGLYRKLTFRIATPEFPNPFSWATVSLDFKANGLTGGAVLYYQSGLSRESRLWDLARQP